MLFDFRSKRKANSDEQDSASTRRKPDIDLSSSAAELPLMEPALTNLSCRVPYQKPAVEKVSVPRLLEKVFPFEIGNSGEGSTNQHVTLYCAESKKSITRPKEALITSNVTNLPVDINHEIGHYRRLVAKDGSAKEFIATFIEVILDRLKHMDRPSMMFVLSSRELLNALELGLRGPPPFFGLVGLLLIRRAATTVAKHDAKTHTLIELIRLTLERSGNRILSNGVYIPSFTKYALNTTHRLLTGLQIKSQLSEHDISIVGDIARHMETVASVDMRERAHFFGQCVYELLDVMAASSSLSEVVNLETEKWATEVSKVFGREFVNAVATTKAAEQQPPKANN